MIGPPRFEKGLENTSLANTKTRDQVVTLQAELEVLGHHTQHTEIKKIQPY